MSTDPMLTFIEEAFERNYELLRHDTSSSLTEEAKEAARQQVLMYWRKLNEVAKSVTDTEIPIALPNQRTPEGRVFAIEGVIDMVRSDEFGALYDIKTHSADHVRSNVDQYRMQLTLYAHLWKALHNAPLRDVAVIATAFPRSLYQALKRGDAQRINEELERWQPLVPMEFSDEIVQRAILDFAKVVDQIENHQFASPSIEVLRSQWRGTQKTFAQRICLECDARHSCNSYRHYVENLDNVPQVDVSSQEQLPEGDDGWFTEVLEESVREVLLLDGN